MREEEISLSLSLSLSLMEEATNNKYAQPS